MSVWLLLTISALIKILSPGTKQVLFSLRVDETVPDDQQQHSTTASLFVSQGSCHNNYNLFTIKLIDKQ